MKHKNKNFSYCKLICGLMSASLFMFATGNTQNAIAAVAQRTPNTQAQTTARPASHRMPTMATNIHLGTVTTNASTNDNTAGNTGTTTTTTGGGTTTGGNSGGTTSGNSTGSTTGGTGGTTTTTPDVPDYSDYIIEDKTLQFDEIVSSSAAGTMDVAATNLAELIRQQRAALDAASAEEFGQKNANTTTSGLSSCDSGLRSCMQQKCGTDYLKCAGDGDTAWGMKMDACRSSGIKCSAHEYGLFAAEIKADRDMNLRLESYQKIIDCGNTYNACIEQECSATFAKCLGKRAGDAAIAKCESIARQCREQDSGLASRTMNVFATLRQDAEKQVKADEKRLYEMRDKMRSLCQRLGAMFDERSLDCVFTVEFWAGGSPSTLYASKKAYAGSTFDCNPGWFGVDITTFKENAYRATREQTSATSALLGAGVGTAVGAITSGAINRAIDRHKADKAVKKAEKEDAASTHSVPDDDNDDDADADKEDKQKNSKSCAGLSDGDECTRHFIGIPTKKGICSGGKCVPKKKGSKTDDNDDNATPNDNGGSTTPGDSGSKNTNPISQKVAEK